MLDHLASACRAARESTGAGQTAIAALLGLNQSSVARFEAGDGWPRDPDAYVMAYAVAGHVGPATIWKDALKRYVEADPAATGPDGVPPELRAVEEALTAAVSLQRRGRAAARRPAAAKRGRKTA